ncbi:MAG: MinD/ParA family protein [Planctomycetes bacterium]|nr:MinD/ParA family protein [Planctomycetota bacterium]
MAKPSSLRHRSERAAPTSVGTKKAATTIAVTSGKGGVGKSNLAVNLATCIQQNGLQTALVDLDMGLANADVLLNAAPLRNLAHVINGSMDVEQVCHLTTGGLKFVAGVAGGGAGAGAESRSTDRAFPELVERIKSISAEVIFFDCAAGIGPNVTQFACAADVVLVVTTPEPTSLVDAYATIKTLLNEGYDGSVRLLVNMVESRGEARKSFGRVRDACEKFINFDIANAGYVLHDTHVELAVRHREPFVTRYPKCSASLCVSVIAARLAGARSFGSGEQRSFLQRVASMF